MKTGKTEYRHGLFLAPMAGVTDSAFRRICKKHGAEGMTTEMVSAKALLFNDKKTAFLCNIGEEEKPCSLQLFGHEPEELARAACLVLKYDPCAIDINMGCPAPKIVNNGDGSALMRDPRLCGRIVRAVRRSLDAEGHCDLPVTVKIRKGFDDGSVNAVETAKYCEDAGCGAITVHGRTRAMMYMPPVDLGIIRDVKDAVSVPVIGNGDIVDEKSAARVFSETHCDGIMIGRGALGNPYIFERIAYFLDTGFELPQVPDGVKYLDVVEHMSLLIESKGEYVGVREARKHIAWYIRGKAGAALLRDEVNRAETKREIMAVAEKAFLST